MVLSKDRVAVLSALTGPLVVSAALSPLSTGFPVVNAALVLLAVVAAVAAVGNRVAGLVSALSAAVWFDFFLVPPQHSLDLTHSDDLWTMALLVVIGAVITEVAVRARRQRERREATDQRLRLLYEAGLAVGTTLDVERTARELARVVVPVFADQAAVDVYDPVLRGGEPPSRDGASLQRVAVSGIPGASLPPPLPAEPGDRVPTPGPGPGGGLGDEGFLLTVPLKVRGVRLGVVHFRRSDQRAPFRENDLSFAEELGAKAAEAMDNARRYVRERSTALTLQRSLLPGGSRAQQAVETASRYLPAGGRAGVGGDWFDVIPLSGARVALVVGDVVGHGIHASATMGRLRTAVRTLSEMELPPDELLTHLDDLVSHLSADQPSVPVDGDGVAFGEVGATCLYVIYDPVTRRCQLATAGHPLPLHLTPDGVVRDISLSVGLPLGVGGLPFTTTELELEPGSVLALYTDGLVVSRRRDFDRGLTELRAALARPASSLEARADAVVDEVLVEGSGDDAALLLARTRALSPDQVVSWDIPADPALVERARRLAIEQLHAWGLAATTFVMELVVSELVTNAILHGAQPIQLRLIRDRTLICEVSDASGTAPHMRRARDFDEHGRGLLLVAQLTYRWGTRPTSGGKTIWCEQQLPVD